MLRTRTVALATSVVLGLAIAAPTTALADPSGQPAPTVTQNASGFTVDLPGIGSLTFMVDPSTGAVSDVVATADSGITAGAPKVTDEGVEVSFTDATGKATVLAAEVENKDGAVKVRPEAEQGDQAGPQRPAGDNEHEAQQAQAHENESEGHDGAQASSARADNEERSSADNSAASAPSASTTSTTAASSEDRGSGEDNGSSGQDGSGGPDRSGGQDGGHDGGDSAGSGGGD